MTDDARVDDVLRRVARLAEQVEQLQQENITLRARLERQPTRREAPPEHRPLTRRTLLGLGGAAAAGAGLAAVSSVLKPEGADAAQFDPWLIGNNQFQDALSATTGLQSTHVDYTLNIINTGTGGGAIGCSAKASNKAGLYGEHTATGVGVWGNATTTGVGVKGTSASSTGVNGTSSSGSGVVGASTDAYGVYGSSTNGVGVQGVGSTFGVFGFASNVGVEGVSTQWPVKGLQSGGGSGIVPNNYAGVFGDGNTVAGVLGYSNTDHGVRAASVAHHAIRAEALGSGEGVIATSAQGHGVRAQGGKAPLWLMPAGTAGAPASGTHNQGELYTDISGVLWMCTADGTPGTWVRTLTNADGGAFVALPPTRLVDTRSGAPVGAGPANERVVQVAGAAGIAADATAVALNLTVTQPSSSGGFVTLYPDDATRPSASNINFNAGQTVANFAMVKLGTGGRIRVYNQVGTVHAILDVAGFYH